MTLLAIHIGVIGAELDLRCFFLCVRPGGLVSYSQ